MMFSLQKNILCSIVLGLDFSFGGWIYASNFIQNKVHIVILICMKFYMNFDGMILTFYTWICVVLCVHQDKLLEEPSLLEHKNMILLISSTQHQMN